MAEGPPTTPDPLARMLGDIRACRRCADDLPCGPRPVVQAAASARLCIVGQAPGRKVHETGIPWDDASGRRLRDWLGLTPAAFYDPAKVAIIPMGFCYPGKAGSGDNKIGREKVGTPVTNAHFVCSLLLKKKKRHSHRPTQQNT